MNKMGTTTKKIRLLLEVLLILTLMITGYNLHKEKQEDQRQFSSFLNHFYFSVIHTEQQIDRVLAVEDNSHLQESFETLQYDLEKANTILEEGRSFVDHSIRHTRYFQEMEFVATGITAHNNGIKVFEFPPFAEDGKIDKDERVILTIIKQDLEGIKQGMYSEETQQEDPNLSLDAFNRVLKPINMKSVYEVYDEYKQKR